MAKLNVTVDITFETKGLMATQDFKPVVLNKEASTALFDSTPAEEIAFRVVSTNEDSEASFLFGRQSGKKNAIFEVRAKPEGAGLVATIRGDFSIVLRKGADSMLKALGANLDLRLQGVSGRGGHYSKNGFDAIIEGGDFEQSNAAWIETFPKVEVFSVK